MCTHAHAGEGRGETPNKLVADCVEIYLGSGAQSLTLGDHHLSKIKSQILDQLSYPGAPYIVVLIYISLVSKNIEHLFMYLLSTPSLFQI